MLCHGFGGTNHNHLPARGPAFRSQIDHPVGRFNHVHVVLDKQYRIACRHQGLKGGQEFSDVVKMKTGGGLVKDEEAFSPFAASDITR